MQAQKQSQTTNFHIKTYCMSWKQFIDRAMQILVQNPTKSRYTIKYHPNKHTFILKVTDGKKIAMIKCSADTGYDQVQKFTKLAGRALSNQSDKKAEENKQQESKDVKKKKIKRKDEAITATINILSINFYSISFFY